MLSSHRILSTATHLGDGVYGNATGQTLSYRIIADYHAINNQINDEWLIRRVPAAAGWDPKAYAADLIEREGGPDSCIRPFTPDIDIRVPMVVVAMTTRSEFRHSDQDHERRFGRHTGQL